MALSASVRATTRVGTPITSAARRAAIRLRSCAWVGISTLPPMWPHFFSEASWSSKWTPEALASMNAFMISKLFSGPPKPASASATIGANQSRLAFSPSACSILVGALQGPVDAAAEFRGGVAQDRGSGTRVHRTGGVRYRRRPASRRGRSPSGRRAPAAWPGYCRSSRPGCSRTASSSSSFHSLSMRHALGQRIGDREGAAQLRHLLRRCRGALDAHENWPAGALGIRLSMPLICKYSPDEARPLGRALCGCDR